MRSDEFQRHANGLDARSSGNPLARQYPRAAPVRLVVESPVATTTEQPISVGVPFPRGVLGDDGGLCLRDPSGARRPLQATALARWPGGSVKWLLIDFLADEVDAGRAAWTLELDAGDRAERARPKTLLHVDQGGRELIVHTGAASFRVGPQASASILRGDVGRGPILADAMPMRAVLTNRHGHVRPQRVERCEVEARGPVRATIRLDGAFGGRRNSCRFLARLSFFAGSSLVRVEFTIHNPRRARHRNGLWDLGDPGSILFRDLSLQLGLRGSGPSWVHWTEEVDGPQRTAEAEPFEIYQDSSGGENWRSRNHVNRRGEIPCRFRGYRVVREGTTASGLRASPIVSVLARAGTVTAAIPEFWQQFPKAIDVRGRMLGLRLFPGQCGDLFELQGGEQKTHTVWLHFSRADQPEIDALRWVHRPARVLCTPSWYASAGVVPYLDPDRPDPADHCESVLAGVVAGPRNLSARREIIDEYGWRHYGEVYADHEEAYYKGEAPIVSHYNNQYDVINGLLTRYFRTEDARWFDLADPLARHVIDIDIYHTREDRPAYNGGLFWHTDHYRDAATATHRTFSRVNRQGAGRSYGGGPANEHNYTTGLLHYYYVTGNPDAREVVLGLADWVVAMDDGARTVFGPIDDGPTGLASCTAQASYHGPGRGCGNSINALLDGWLLSGSRDYLEKAEELIRRAVHPATDIPGLDLLETELRWSYTVFLSVLARYLDLKVEAGELDRMYAYARACLLAFAAWMLDNEVPYFDSPEKLEFPTETWAAQDLRKANVLRLAARHADGPLRSRLVRRGGELADRAWNDLLQFPSRDVARSAALVMAEGVRDSYWRTHPIGDAPAPSQGIDFGSPGAFIPQKRRILDRLRTSRGAFDALRGLASIEKWGRFLTHLANRSVLGQQTRKTL